MVDDVVTAEPGTVVVFETIKGKLRQAVSVRVHPYRSIPVLVIEVITPATKFREVAETNPQLTRAFNLTDYHWDTSAYRDLCHELGLDPDVGRPVFRSPNKETAAKLLEIANLRFSEKRSEPYDTPRFSERLFDILDLMRADLRPDPNILDRARKKWSAIDDTAAPDFAELERLVFSNELLDISAEQHLSNPSIRNRASAWIEFLPSRHGTGWLAKISGFYADHDPDGWVGGDYWHLHGIAVEPTDEEMETMSWFSVVRRRLAAQGVIFIPRNEVKRYLDTEAAYVCRKGRFLSLAGFGRTGRQATWLERQLWKLKPPPLPYDQKLASQEPREQTLIRMLGQK